MVAIIIVVGLLFLMVSLIFLFRFIIDKRTDAFMEDGKHSEEHHLVKKYEVSNIHKYSGLLANIGLVISLAVVITAFEWKDYDAKATQDLPNVSDDFEDIIEIPPTSQPPPPPPKIQQPEIIEVPDEEEIEEEIEVNLDVEVTEETVIEEVIDEEPEEEEIEQVFLIVEDQPEPTGGMGGFYEYLGKNIRYPEQARRMGVEGRVFVEFVVDKTGNLTEVRVVKGIGAGCDEEAVRVVKNSPNWKPGKQRGRPVKVKMTVPVFFKLS
jgi:protein TonB